MSLKTLYNEFYGDETRWWVGVVQSVDDPVFQGRVKVRIYGIHSASETDIPNESLPWAQVIAPITQGGTSGVNGTPVGIQPYAQVFGIFLDGKHSQLPLVLGSIPRVDGTKPEGYGAAVVGGRGAPATAPESNTSETGDAVSTNDQDNINPDTNDPRGEAIRTRPVAATPTPGVAPVEGTVQRSTGSLVGGDNVEKCYNFFVKAFNEEGLSNAKELAAGFVGNFILESQCNPLIENPQGFVGIAQWGPARYSGYEHALVEWSNKNGFELTKSVKAGGKAGTKYVPDLLAQLNFVLYELDKLRELRWDSWKNIATNPDIAADRVEAFYETAEFSVDVWKKTPDGKKVLWKFAPYEERKNRGSNRGGYQQRIQYARDVYKTYAINGGGS